MRGRRPVELLLDHRTEPGYCRTSKGGALAIRELEALEQALLVAAAIGADGCGSALERVHGESGRRCRAALDELAGLPAAERHRYVASATRSLFASIPARLDRAHPSWLEERLRNEPAALASVVRASLPPDVEVMAADEPRSACAPSIRAVVCRSVLQGLLPSLPSLPAPAEAAGAPERLEDLAAWSGPRLERLLRCLGRLGIASLLGRAPELAPTMLARLPEEDARAVRDELPAAPPPPPVLLRGWGPDAAREPEQVCARTGALLLGAGLPEGVRPAVALLLPRHLGALLFAAVPELEPGLLLSMLKRATGRLEEDR